MHDVEEVAFGVPCNTRIWFSKRVQEEVAKFRAKGDPNGLYWMKLRRCAQNGFQLYEKVKNPPVRHEGDGVFRIGFTDSLFRIIGFYSQGKAEFIAIDAFLKKGQKLNASERARVAEVARVKQHNLWRKVPNAGYPRPAQ